MAKIFTYTIMLIGITTLAKIAGIPLPSKALFDWIGFGASNLVATGLFFGVITAALLAFAGANAIAATFFGRQVPESTVRAGIAVTLIAATVPDILGLLTYVSSQGYPIWIVSLINLIVWPLLAGYGIAIVQWFGGQDL